jgi:hypothetical protein
MASIITRDQSDEFVKTVECGKGKIVDWAADKKQLLAAKDIDRCFILVITNKEHGLLFHFQISDENKCKETYFEFCKWLPDNQDMFKAARLFIICPTKKIERAEELLAQYLMEELVRVIKLQPKFVDVDDMEKKELSSVELYGDGTGNLPVVRCNGARITPAVPSYDSKT